MQQIQSGDFEKLTAKYAKSPITAKRIVKKALQKAGLLQTAKNIKKRIIH